MFAFLLQVIEEINTTLKSVRLSGSQMLFFIFCQLNAATEVYSHINVAEVSFKDVQVIPVN